VFGTGAFARLAQVSVRTLHHYDDIGLLPPARVDQQTGYRWYAAEQLHRLNRILALRDLGLPLTEVRKVVDDEVSLDELRGMLRLRQAEAHERITAEAERLARVEARLRQIEMEGRVGDYDVVVKPLESHHVALDHECTTSFGNANLGPILGRLFGDLYAELDRVGIAPAGPMLALYEDSGDADAPIKVMAAVPVDDTEIVTSDRIEIVDVPAVPRGATTIHRGSMAHVDEGYQALFRWAEETGEHIDGYSREIYLACDGDPETWVTELQFALHERGPGTKEEA
jgi:DNA-binding transcriptional MerR regulator